jgi:hypothetical protein
MIKKMKQDDNDKDLSNSDEVTSSFFQGRQMLNKVPEITTLTPPFIGNK